MCVCNSNPDSNSPVSGEGQEAPEVGMVGVLGVIWVSGVIGVSGVVNGESTVEEVAGTSSTTILLYQHTLG